MATPLKLLIVEDSTDDLDLLIHHLKKGGCDPTYERVETESAMEAALEKNEWDVVLCDYNLPTFGALSALSLSKRKKPIIPFIVVSGSVSEELAIMALKAGANDYILKNNLTRLIPAIEREMADAKSRYEHLKIEEDLKKKDEQLRRAQRLDAVGQLAGGIAHDFNNILGIILLQTDLMMEEINSNPDLKKNTAQIHAGLEQIRKSGERASNLTRQLLAFSRKQVSQPRVLNLNELVSDSEKMLRPIIEENIDFKIRLSKDLKNIKVDPGHLEQIIMNLVVNSRDSMPEGGTLTLETQNIHVDDVTSRQNGVKTGSYVLLTVSDTGCGMDAETEKHIFEPFFTTKEIGKGTGLGLSIVYGIVKQNKGFIFFESKLNHGTQAKVYFQQVDDEISVVSIKTAKKIKGTETILFVEDEEELRSLACEALEGNGYHVLQASNGGEALELVRTYGKPIDLVITDVVMPKMNGPEFFRQVQDLKFAAPFLFLSGYTENVLIQQGLNMGQIHFLEKPYSLKTLMEKVQTVLSEVCTTSIPPRASSAK